MGGKIEEKDRGSILLVDDNLTNLMVLDKMLSKKRYVVRQAKDGKEALEKAKSDPPDLILLDIRLPDMVGYEVCKKLKADKETKNSTIIFISALDEVLDKVRAFEVGGADYITKPFQIEEVMVRVKTHFDLRNMQNELQMANDHLELSVRQRTAELAQANKELVKAKETAEAASRAKTEFLHNISHELRTPLNPIIGMTDLVLKTTNPTIKQHEYLDRVLDSAGELLSIIDDLIELSRLEADGVEPVMEVFTPKMLLDSAIEVLLPQSKTKALTLKSHVEDDVPEEMAGDPELLVKILIKLGENSVKFTEEGEITLSISKESERGSTISLLFSVSDTGIGIPGELLNNIFRDFTQADGSKTRKYGGMGLGLTMVRRLVENLGGRIWAESEPLKGSTFHFSTSFDKKHVRQ